MSNFINNGRLFLFFKYVEILTSYDSKSLGFYNITSDVESRYTYSSLGTDVKNGGAFIT
jgi:hypothetical protein